MTIASADTIRITAANTVDVESSNDNTLFSMSEFAESMMKKEGDTPTGPVTQSAEASAPTSLAGLDAALLQQSSLYADGLTSVGTDSGTELAFSETDRAGNRVSAIARRGEDNSFTSEITLQTKNPAGELASKSIATITETADGKNTSEFTTEIYNTRQNSAANRTDTETQSPIYILRKQYRAGEGVSVTEKTLQGDGTYAESTHFLPESA